MAGRRESVPSRKVRLINQLTHTKGPFAGQPFNLRPWQEKQIIRPLFAVNKRTGRRQYRTCLLMMPRKNGKTELCAALAIDGLLFDDEIGAEVYSAASDKDQAALCFNVAAQMIRNDPELYAACEIIDSQKRIVHRRTGSIYRAISAEAYSKHGFNASRVIYDELHAAATRDLFDVLASATIVTRFSGSSINTRKRSSRRRASIRRFSRFCSKRRRTPIGRAKKHGARVIRRSAISDRSRNSARPVRARKKSRRKKIFSGGCT